MPRLPPLEFRRLLRKRSTDAEHALWSRLRRHRMGPRFRRQHTVGPYTLDFYCPAARLAIELDGGQHYEQAQRERDERRDQWLAERGIRVLRYSDRDALLETEAIEEAIWLAIRDIDGQPPSPRPSPPADAAGEGGSRRGRQRRSQDVPDVGAVSSSVRRKRSRRFDLWA
jgi:very-short-patch-repair endonuclease